MSNQVRSLIMYVDVMTEPGYPESEGQAEKAQNILQTRAL
jgi:hypothetical protein